MSRIKFYKCEKCGKTAMIIGEGASELGAGWEELIPNTVDAAKEKHVPVVAREDGKIAARVGSVTHPMEDKHSIQWILFDDGTTLKRVDLRPGEEPKAVFCGQGPVTVYEYCNLHGLWMTEFKD